MVSAGAKSEASSQRSVISGWGSRYGYVGSQGQSHDRVRVSVSADRGHEVRAPC